VTHVNWVERPAENSDPLHLTSLSQGPEHLGGR
jgi:hypothetical protein